MGTETIESKMQAREPSAAVKSVSTAKTTAELIYERQLLVWKDHTEHSATLRERRKIFNGLIVLAMSLGFVKFSFFKSPTDVLVLSADSLGLIRITLTTVFVLIGLATYFLNTNSSKLRRPIFQLVWKAANGLIFRICQKLKVDDSILHGLEEVKKLKMDPSLGSRAVAALFLNEQEIAVMHSLPPSHTIEMWNFCMVEAVELLVQKNSRVSKRIKYGGFFLALAYVAGLFSVAYYVWSI